MDKENNVFIIFRTLVRLAGLKHLFSDVKESAFNLIFASFCQTMPVLMCLDAINYSRRFTEKEKLMNLVGNCLAIILASIAQTIIICMKKNSSEIKTIFLEMLQVHKAKFEVLEPIYNKNFRKEMDFCKLIFKFLYSACWITFFGFVAFGTLFSYHFDQNLYPLPIFYEIIFFPPTGLISYSINWIAQLIVVSMTFINFVCGSSAIIYSLTIVGCLLDTTKETVDEMKNISEQIGLDNWLKTVMESIDTSKRMLILIRKITNFVFYLCEKVCYAAIFVSWVIWHIDPRQAFLSAGALCVVFAVFLIVVVNEIMLDKFDDLASALYDAPWYELKPKEMTAFIILIQTAQNPVSLSSAGLSDITYEWFADLMKSGYSAGLVLQDLVAV